MESKATFAGGCFWCLEPPFEHLDGVKKIEVGYTGGETKNPTYEQVSSGKTGHKEAIQIIYDPKRISYETLLDTFFRHIDPTDEEGQFVDIGSQYTTAIFYHNEEQRKIAEKVKKSIAFKFKLNVKTKILPGKTFYPAEDYHQKYHRKNPFKYEIYKKGSGRKSRLEDLYSKK